MIVYRYLNTNNPNESWHEADTSKVAKLFVDGDLESVELKYDDGMIIEYRRW